MTLTYRHILIGWAIFMLGLAVLSLRVQGLL